LCLQQYIDRVQENKLQFVQTLFLYLLTRLCFTKTKSVSGGTMAADQSPASGGQTVGARLRAARRAKKYTQGQLAAPDFSVSYISAIERGQIQPSLRALEILARRLELSTADLLPEQAGQQVGTAIDMDPAHNGAAEIEFTLLEAHIFILQGNAAQAITALQALGEPLLPELARLRQLYLLGWAYLLSAHFHQSEHTLAAARLMAQAQNNSHLELRITDLLGLAYAAMHNPQRALQLQQECLQLTGLERHPYDLFFLCRIYNHLGSQQLELNDSASALTTFQQAAALADELARPTRVRDLYRDLSGHHSQAAEYTLAAVNAQKSLLLDSTPSGGMTRSEMYLYLGRAMMKSDMQALRPYLEEELRQKLNLQDALTRASITIRLAEWHLCVNELAAAAAQAAEAYHLAQPYGDTLIAVETLVIRGRVQYALAQFEAGDEHFVAGLAMLERLQIDDELSEQLAQYAQLLAESDKAQEAITYYKRAFERRRSAAYLS
jgi:transcriptional regulator with XRE-family HTH domain